LKDSAGTVIESESESFDVKAKPKPAASSNNSSGAAAAVESSKSIQDQIGNLSPTAESAVSPVFKLVDGSRSAIANVLDSQLAQTKPKVTSIPLPGSVLGTSTQRDTTVPSESNWFWSIFYTIYFYILTILRFIVGSAGVFYPLVAIVFFYILWRTYKRFRRD
ncbi:MAG TPA: hypothetical protein VGP13_01410, partial [Candidatus Paceibacterota bacterium]|nr:hypothetical protein [Candidatus Paceibacterota bacterium]